MIYLDVQLFPEDRPSAAQHVAHVAIVDVTPDDDPADYVAVVFDQALEIHQVRRVDEHRRGRGWQALIARAIEPGTPAIDAQALAVADRAQQTVVEAADRHCVLGQPVRRLRRLAGDQWPAALRAIEGRATTHCTGSLCDGTAHGEVLVGSAFEDALAAMLDSDNDAQGRGQRG